MKADGSGKRQLTNLNAASFAPSFFPDGKRIIFATNVGSTGGMGNFELYTINVDGTGLERVTYFDGFDGFPMFSPNGKQLVWISHRNGRHSMRRMCLSRIGWNNERSQVRGQIAEVFSRCN